jgi:hypothetical protein
MGFEQWLPGICGIDASWLCRAGFVFHIFNQINSSEAAENSPFSF